MGGLGRPVARRFVGFKQTSLSDSVKKLLVFLSTEAAFVRLYYSNNFKIIVWPRKNPGE